MSSSSHTTIDHDEIKKWMESRGAEPAAVASTHSEDDPGLIRVNFPNDPDGKDDRLMPITWDEFFQSFEENELAFLYQDTKADGEVSYFSRFVKREGAKDGNGKNGKK